MKLSTGTTLTCPQCGAALWSPSDKSLTKNALFEPVVGTGDGVLSYRECRCGLVMLCRFTGDGWEYRVML